MSKEYGIDIKEVIYIVEGDDNVKKYILKLDK